jgi:hypothetical protein
MAVKITISITGVRVAEVDQIPHQPRMNVQLAMEETYNLHSDKTSISHFDISAAIWAMKS